MLRSTFCYTVEMLHSSKNTAVVTNRRSVVPCTEVYRTAPGVSWLMSWLKTPLCDVGKGEHEPRSLDDMNQRITMQSVFAFHAVHRCITAFRAESRYASVSHERIWEESIFQMVQAEGLMCHSSLNRRRGRTVWLGVHRSNVWTQIDNSYPYGQQVQHTTTTVVLSYHFLPPLPTIHSLVVRPSSFSFLRHVVLLLLPSVSDDNCQLPYSTHVPVQVGSRTTVQTTSSFGILVSFDVRYELNHRGRFPVHCRLQHLIFIKRRSKPRTNRF